MYFLKKSTVRDQASLAAAASQRGVVSLLEPCCVSTLECSLPALTAGRSPHATPACGRLGHGDYVAHFPCRRAPHAAAVYL